jgi:glycosyltransferase involved in cell wall biosynthesis
MLRLATAFASYGHRVDLVLCQVAGPYLHQLPAAVNVVALKPSPGWLGRASVLAADPLGLGALLLPILLPRKPPGTVRYVPDLARYLQRQQPAVLLSAKPPANLAALWAQRLAKVTTRIVISERTHLSQELQGPHKRKWRWRFIAPLIQRVYPWADAIVSVSNGVADDLSVRTRIPRERITTIYNPTATFEKMDDPTLAAHAWFSPTAPPVILGMGRLVAQKDFSTLLRAFAQVRAERPVRLIILGEGRQRAELEALVTKLGISAYVCLPGFVDNPYAYLSQAALFVLSSAWEGLPNALIEALACGCPVVSTDCPSGPTEILDGGAYGPLVPVGDDAALAQAILSVLQTPPDPDRLRTRAAAFSLHQAADRYLQVLLENQ